MSEEKIKLELKKPGNGADNVTELYIQSVIAVPQFLARIVECLEEMNGCLSMLALYAERKGANEALISPDDLERAEEADGPVTPN